MIGTLLNAIGIFILVGFPLGVMGLVYRRRYRRIGPDEARIVDGKRSGKATGGLRGTVGGGTFVAPSIEPGMSVDEIRDALTRAQRRIEAVKFAVQRKAEPGIGLDEDDGEDEPRA